MKISVRNTASDKCFNGRLLDEHLSLGNLETRKLFILCRLRVINLNNCQTGTFGYLKLRALYTFETRGPDEVKIKRVYELYLVVQSRYLVKNTACLARLINLFPVLPCITAYLQHEHDIPRDHS
jgi:hypothetical protein